MDGESEYIPLDVMIANFSLERVNQSAASFDPDKLYWLAGEYMKQLPLADKVAGCLPFLRRAELIPEADPLATELMDRITRVIDASGDRIKLFSDAMALAKPFLEGELTYDAKAIEKRLKKPGALAVLQEFAGVLATCEPFDVPTLEKTLHDFCAAKEMKSGELVHPVRVAITGSEVGIGLFDALAILGRDEVQRRIERAVVLATA
jgi:glutamyl-tRNA synthetase